MPRVDPIYLWITTNGPCPALSPCGSTRSAHYTYSTLIPQRATLPHPHIFHFPPMAANLDNSPLLCEFRARYPRVEAAVYQAIRSSFGDSTVLQRLGDNVDDFRRKVNEVSV